MSDRRETVVNVERPATHTETVYKEKSSGTGILMLLVLAAIVIGLAMFFMWRPSATPPADTNVTIENPATPATPSTPEPATPAPAPAPSAMDPAPATPPPPAMDAEPAPEPAVPAPAPAPAPAPTP